MAEVRQQLSSDSLLYLEAAANAEISRLRAMRFELARMGVRGEALDALDRRIESAELAVHQLNNVYLDQFDEGRAENDRHGRTGLVKGVAPTGRR